MQKQNLNNPKLTESDIVNYVILHGKYINGEYIVSWNGKAYAANDTRSLVVKICKMEGITVTK